MISGRKLFVGLAVLLVVILSGCQGSGESALNQRGAGEEETQLAIDDLQSRLDLPDPGTIRVESIEPASFDEDELGVPVTGGEDGAQAVEGYEIVLSVPLEEGRQEYLYHVAAGKAVLVPAESGEPVMGEPELLAALEDTGVDVVPSLPEESLEEPLFSAPDRPIGVNGEVVHVFPYEEQGAAEAETARITAEGVDVEGEIVRLPGTPHFFQNGRLIVLYTGEDNTVLQALTDVLGQEIQ